MNALGLVTNTLSSCRGTSNVIGEDEVESKYIPSDTKVNEGVTGVLLVEKTLKELFIVLHLSMSFSLNSFLESGES